MSGIRRHRKEREDKEKIAETVKQRLVLLISFLIGILLFMLFRVGEALWPLWMIEASSNTRTLSGPGKNPKGPNLE